MEVIHLVVVQGKVRHPTCWTCMNSRGERYEGSHATMLHPGDQPEVGCQIEDGQELQATIAEDPARYCPDFMAEPTPVCGGCAGEIGHPLWLHYLYANTSVVEVVVCSAECKVKVEQADLEERQHEEKSAAEFIRWDRTIEDRNF